MKTLGLLIGLLLTNFIASAQNPDKGITITVNIENVMNDKGMLLASLHNSETFMKGEGLKYVAVASKVGELALTFENVAPGEYAIMLLHDENNNQRMDFETNGMPKEPYATTGDMELYGPPTYNGAKFAVADENLEFTVRF